MAYNYTFLHDAILIEVCLCSTALPDHLSYGLFGVAGIIRGVAVSGGYLRRHEFEVRKVYIYISVQHQDHIGRFVSTAIVDKWEMEVSLAGHIYG